MAETTIKHDIILEGIVDGIPEFFESSSQSFRKSSIPFYVDKVLINPNSEYIQLIPKQRIQGWVDRKIELKTPNILPIYKGNRLRVCDGVVEIGSDTIKPSLIELLDEESNIIARYDLRP